MAKQAQTDIQNPLHSTGTGNIVVYTDEVMDDDLGLKQNAINKFYHDRIHDIESETWLYAIIDINGYLLWGINKFGKTYQAKGIPEDTKKELEKIYKNIYYYNERIHDVNNDEYLYVITDKKGNLLWGIRKKDGRVYQPAGIPEDTKRVLGFLKYPSFEPFHDYTTEDIIKNDLYLYKPKVGFKSGAEFNLEDWIEVTIVDVFQYSIEKNVLAIEVDEDGNVWGIYGSEGNIKDVMLDEDTGEIFVDVEVG